LSEAGVPVLILEKKQFPRYKVCGGGLTHKVLGEIPFDITPVLETTIRSVRFSCNFSNVFTRTAAEPVMYCTMRDRLDDFLLEKARQAGARILMGETVRDIIPGSDTVDVVTPDGTLQCHLLIGADGASGIVARKAGLWQGIEPGMAWEAEVEADPDSVREFSGTVFLDWGTFPGGYGWVFPKKDHFSIGVGGPAGLSGWMKPYYERFTGHLTPVIGIASTRSLSSWPIPVRTRKGMFHAGRVLVAGDAGGLSDPLTGEGICYAIRSGTLAAAACLDYLKGNEKALERYSGEINDVLMPELLEARRISALFQVVPGRIHRWVRDEDRVWRAFGKVLRGERNYRDVRRGFGKFRFLWGTATAAAGTVASFIQKRFRRKGL
jgi:geranylgeranyl reductase family protein